MDRSAHVALAGHGQYLSAVELTGRLARKSENLRGDEPIETLDWRHARSRNSCNAMKTVRRLLIIIKR